jgi:hypothetical protein
MTVYRLLKKVGRLVEGSEPLELLHKRGAVFKIVIPLCSSKSWSIKLCDYVWITCLFLVFHSTLELFYYQNHIHDVTKATSLKS